MECVPNIWRQVKQDTEVLIRSVLLQPVKLPVSLKDYARSKETIDKHHHVAFSPYSSVSLYESKITLITQGKLLIKHFLKTPD